MLEKSLSLPLVKAIAIAIGIFVVLFGMADIASRLGSGVFGSFSNMQIFASPASQAANSPLLAQAPSATSSSISSPVTAVPLVPARIKIQSIGVDAAVEQVGTTAAGAMATPKSFATVGWYAPSQKPGQEGSAVFAGHVNNALTKAGVFEHLGLVKVGDTITVSDTDNKMLTYVVSEIDQYPAEGAPLASIFASSGPSQLVLITCDGSWDGSAHTFDKRLVVYAALSGN